MKQDGHDEKSTAAPTADRGRSRDKHEDLGTKMMQNMMSQMVIGSDLQRVGMQIDKPVGNMDKKNARTNERVDNFEKQMAEFRRDLDHMKLNQQTPPPKRPPRRSIGAASSSSGTSSAATSANEWMPRVTHVRGWYPFGAGVAAQINRADARKLQEDIFECIADPEVASRKRWITPFMNNLRVSAEALRCMPRDAKFLSDVIAEGMQRASTTIRDCAVKCSAETNPRRITAPKESNRQYESMFKLNPGCGFEACQRGLGHSVQPSGWATIAGQTRCGSGRRPAPGRWTPTRPYT